MSFEKIKSSFLASAGDIVFGMEDGTVSIFGLVFGVAATTTDRAVVLVAGASGAVAAAVSMMAGTYLDVETRRDEARTLSAALQSDVANDPKAVMQRITDHLGVAGLNTEESRSVAKFLSADPALLKGVAFALAKPAEPDDGEGPLAQSLWMLVADFLAAAIPIVPFAIWPVPEGRIVSATLTLLLLIALGFGRAWIGQRNVARTVTETVMIGVAAAAAGVAIGVAISRAFGA